MHLVWGTQVFNVLVSPITELISKTNVSGGDQLFSREYAVSVGSVITKSVKRKDIPQLNSLPKEAT